MNTEISMERLRRANPVATRDTGDPALFATIVGDPGDRRLARRPSMIHRRKGAQRLAIAAAVLAFGAGAAWAAADGALELFSANPQGRDAGPASVWNQDVVPASVARAAMLTIPQYGTVRFWYAEARQGGWCGAVQLRDGSWAATKGSESGGTAPGCYPTREQVNGNDPVYVINGFDYYDVEVDARERGGSFWRVYYGVVSPELRAARVVDAISGARAHVFRGTAFALAIPDADPDRAVPAPHYATHLVAYDAAGRIVADEHPGDR